MPKKSNDLLRSELLSIVGVGLRWRSNGTINSPRPSDAARRVFVVIGVTLY